MVAVESLIAEVQGSNIFLFLVLIMLFVVGYKILQAVIRLGMVSILSGVFLVVMNAVGLGPAVTVDRFLLFMVLGTALFIGYSMLFTAIRTASGVLDLLSTLGHWFLKPFKHHREKSLRKELKALKEKQRESSDASTKEKAIVLDEVDDD